MDNKIVKNVTVLLIVMAFAVVQALILMYLWNDFIKGTFGWRALTIPTAYALTVLIELLTQRKRTLGDDIEKTVANQLVYTLAACLAVGFAYLLRLVF